MKWNFPEVSEGPRPSACTWHGSAWVWTKRRHSAKRCLLPHKGVVLQGCHRKTTFWYITHMYQQRRCHSPKNLYSFYDVLTVVRTFGDHPPKVQQRSPKDEILTSAARNAKFSKQNTTNCILNCILPPSGTNTPHQRLLFSPSAAAAAPSAASPAAPSPWPATRPPGAFCGAWGVEVDRPPREEEQR